MVALSSVLMFVVIAARAAAAPQHLHSSYYSEPVPYPEADPSNPNALFYTISKPTKAAGIGLIMNGDVNFNLTLFMREEEISANSLRLLVRKVQPIPNSYVLYKDGFLDDLVTESKEGQLVDLFKMDHKPKKVDDI